MLTCPVLAIFVATVGLGILWAARALHREPLVVRICFAISSIGTAAAVLRLVALTASSPLRQWNGARLAPLIAFANGIPLYGDPKTGVLSAWIYGPLPAIAYLPTALLHRPTGCIILGVTLSELMIFTPAVAAMLYFMRRAGSSGKLIGPLVIGISLWIVLRSESLIDGIFFILSEAPASALAGTVCILLMFHRSPRAVRISAGLTVLACWCKQTVLPFAIVPALFLWIVEDRRAAFLYGRWLIGLAIQISVILICAFGPRAMYFNMITIPSHQPFQFAEHGIAFALFRALWDWSKQVMVPAMPLAVAFFIAVVLPRGQHEDSFLKRRPWTILLLTGVSLLPSSLLGYAKVSGYFGNFAISQFFLLAGGAAGVIHLWPEFIAARPRLANWVACGGCVLLLWLGISADATTPGALDAMGTQIASPERNPQEIMFDFDRVQPGVAYFPWDPLPALLAEGKLYHFEWGYVDRLTSGIAPSREQILAHVPPHMQLIALPLHTTTHFALRFFPQFTMPVTVPGLPGFTVFARSGGAAMQ